MGAISFAMCETPTLFNVFSFLKSVYITCCMVKKPDRSVKVRRRSQPGLESVENVLFFRIKPKQTKTSGDLKSDAETGTCTSFIAAN